MKRTEAIAKITAILPRLSDEGVETLAELAESLTDDTQPAEDDATRAAIREGIEQARRGELASEEEVEEAFARFRK